MPDRNLETVQKLDVDGIQDTIRTRICLLDYPPGTVLKETALAAEFGVSRTPLREALNRLSHLGLIETRNGVGTFVVEFSHAHVTQIYEMRLELASLIGKLSPNEITQDHVARAEMLLTRAKDLTGDFDAYDYFQINHQLAYLIMEIIGNRALRLMWEQLYCQAASTWYRLGERAGCEVADALVNELSELVVALKQRDPEAVGFVQRIHINYGFDRIKKTLFKSA